VRPLIAGNWKMNGLTAQLGEIEAMAASVTAKPVLADVLICTPATLIARAVQIADGRIGIGGQDCHAAIGGAFTGDISAEMLKDAGASWVIVGHSERRQHHGETDAIVAAKSNAAGRAGLRVRSNHRQHARGCDLLVTSSRWWSGTGGDACGCAGHTLGSAQTAPTMEAMLKQLTRRGSPDSQDSDQHRIQVPP